MTISDSDKQFLMAELATLSGSRREAILLSKKTFKDWVKEIARWLWEYLKDEVGKATAKKILEKVWKLIAIVFG